MGRSISNLAQFLASNNLAKIENSKNPFMGRENISLDIFRPSIRARSPVRVEKLYLNPRQFLAYLGSCGRNHSHGHNHGHFFLSFVNLVCFLRKFIEFYDTWTECQIIIFHFLLPIYHTLPAFAKICPLQYLIYPPDRYCYRYATNVMVYIKRRWWSTKIGEVLHDGGGDTCRVEGG